MGYCPQSNHHRSHRHSGSFRFRRLQVAMRTITLLIIHCSATPQGVCLSLEDCRREHIRHRGFSDIGYHFYVTRDGEIHRGRPTEKSVRIASTITATPSASVTKEDWMPKADRPTPARWNKRLHCWPYCAS